MKKLGVLCSLMLFALLVSSVLVGCDPTKGTAEWHAQQGYKLAEQDSFDEAIGECSKVIELAPNFSDAYNNRGGAYLYLDRYEQAIEDFSEAISPQPSG